MQVWSFTCIILNSHRNYGLAIAIAIIIVSWGLHCMPIHWEILYIARLVFTEIKRDQNLMTHAANWRTGSYRHIIIMWIPWSHRGKEFLQELGRSCYWGLGCMARNKESSRIWRVVAIPSLCTWGCDGWVPSRRWGVVAISVVEMDGHNYASRSIVTLTRLVLAMKICKWKTSFPGRIRR